MKSKADWDRLTVLHEKSGVSRASAVSDMWVQIPPASVVILAWYKGCALGLHPREGGSNPSASTRTVAQKRDVMKVISYHL